MRSAIRLIQLSLTSSTTHKPGTSPQSNTASSYQIGERIHSGCGYRSWCDETFSTPIRSSFALHRLYVVLSQVFLTPRTCLPR